MRLWRTLPPAAAPIEWRDLKYAVTGALTRTETFRARERELREEFGVDGVFLMSSGSGALALTLRALRTLSSRTDVIIPAYTCFSLPAAVLEAGLRPVPCDINPTTFDFDRAMLRVTLSPRTLCVIGHHLFGVPLRHDDAAGDLPGEWVLPDRGRGAGDGPRGWRPQARNQRRRRGFQSGPREEHHLRSGWDRDHRVAGNRRCDRARISTPCTAHPRGRGQGPVGTDADGPVRATPAVLDSSGPALPASRRDPVPQGGSDSAAVGRQSRGASRLATTADGVEPAARGGGEVPDRHRLPLRLLPGVDHPYLRVPFRVRNASEKQRLCAMSRRRGLGLSPAYPTAVTEIPGVPLACEGRRFPSAQRVAASLVTIPTHPLVTEHDRIAIAELCRDFRSVS